MRKALFILLQLCCVCLVHAQMGKPVVVTAAFREVSSAEAEITFTAAIRSGWHLYGTQVVDGGPVPTTLTVERIEGTELDGALTATAEPVRKYEEMFQTDVYYFERSVTFVQKVRLLGGKYEVVGYLRYSACDDRSCTPPTTLDFSFSGEVKPQTDKVANAAVPQTLVASDTLTIPTEPQDTSTASVQETGVPSPPSIWDPVADQLAAFGGAGAAGASTSSLWEIFLLGLLGGLLALATPCVWPVIPMTVSFFLKRGLRKTASAGEVRTARRKGVRDAVLYGLCIVVIFETLGLAVTAISDASTLNGLATNAVVNILLFVMLVVFGLSLIGGFELTLPAKWNTAVDNKAATTTGVVSVFLMAATLVLVSFSCTVPIVGFLLVQVTAAEIAGPAVGMLGFALALAFPFTLFALFPQWLSSMPKSGAWMNAVKVSLGFVELAFALKFLSVADLAYGWRLLDREVFLSLWIVLAALLGAYFIGWVRFPHDNADGSGIRQMCGKTSVPRFLLALASFAFAVYMLPGLWGAPLRAISAFAPPMRTQDFNANPNADVRLQFSDYEEGMRHAREKGLPVLLDFTGYGCVNCRKMEAAVFADPAVADAITRHFVVVRLHVDDKTPLPQSIEVPDGDGVRKLRTVGDRWSHLQSVKFGAATQPFYVLLDNDGRPLTYAYSYNEDIPAFLNWLDGGQRKYEMRGGEGKGVEKN